MCTREPKAAHLHEAADLSCRDTGLCVCELNAFACTAEACAWMRGVSLET